MFYDKIVRLSTFYKIDKLTISVPKIYLKIKKKFNIGNNISFFNFKRAGNNLALNIFSLALNYSL